MHTASPWQLNSFFFTRTVCIANPNFDPEVEERDDKLAIEVKAYTSDAHTFNAELRLDIGDQGQNSSYQIGLSIYGTFTAPGDDSPATPNNVEARLNTIDNLIPNAAQLLYGIARDNVATLTSKGPWNTVFLPTMFLRPDQALKISPELQDLFAKSKTPPAHQNEKKPAKRKLKRG